MSETIRLRIIETWGIGRVLGRGRLLDETGAPTSKVVTYGGALTTHRPGKVVTVERRKVIATDWLPVEGTEPGEETTRTVKARELEPGDRIDGAEVITAWAYQEDGTAVELDTGRLLTFEDDEDVEVDL